MGLGGITSMGLATEANNFERMNWGCVTGFGHVRQMQHVVHWDGHTYASHILQLPVCERVLSGFAHPLAVEISSWTGSQGMFCAAPRKL